MNDLQSTAKKNLWQKLRNAEDIAATLMILHEVDEVSAAGEPSLDGFDLMRLRRSVFAALRDFTTHDPEQAQRLILDQLLWRCLRVIPRKKDDEWEVIEENGRVVKQPSIRQAERIEAHELREELGKWIEGYGQGKKQVLRDAVLEDLINQVPWIDGEAEFVQAALWTLSAIGYRSSQVEDVLWQVMDREDIAGDSAYGALAGLGVSIGRRAEFEQKVRGRIPLRPVRALGYALQQIAHPSLLDAALTLFQTSSEISYDDGQPKMPPDSLDREEHQSADQYNLFIKLTMLSHFADALWDEEEVQDIIWKKMLASCRETERGRGRLLLGGNLGPWCNTRHLVQDFLELLQQEISAQESKPGEIMPGHYHIYLACLRLQEAVRPQQLHGWEEASSEVLDDVRCTAVSNTQQSGYHSTSPMRAKQIAWQTLACAGGRWTSEEVQRAVADENSGYVQGEVADVVACFGCDPLPPIVSTLLRQKLDLKAEDQDTSRFSAARGAENLARSTASREAFEALLNFGFLYNDEVLRSTSDALDEVSVWLAREDKSIAERLMEVADDSKSPPHHRIVAISSLHALASHHQLPAEYWLQLLEIAKEPSIKLEDYYRSLAVQAIGFLTDPEVQRAAVPHLYTLYKEQEGSRVSMQACEALARHGTWRQDAVNYLAAIGLEQRKGVWRVAAPAQLDSQEAFILGLLYSQIPHELERATIDVLENSSDEAVYALVRLLANKDEAGQRRLSPGQARILAADLFENSSSYRARLYLFEALALAMPEVLVEPQWEERWSQWLPSAHVALADALGQVQWESEAQRRRASLLLYSLLGNGLYAVRRAAARALSTIDSNFLTALCREWQQSPIVEERKRAGEAAGWLESLDPLRELIFDVESTVRIAAERARNERRKRLWAIKYRKQVLISGRDDVARTYRFGTALIQIGDDEDLRRLQFHLTQNDIAPNVRVWLSQVVEELEKKWHEQTQKWPEPWLQWQGIVHELDAVVLQNNKTVNVRVSLWQRPAEGIRGVSDWGGSLWPLQDEDFWSIDVGDAQLDIVGHDSAQILIGHHSTSSTTLFFGQGYFPKPVIPDNASK